MGTHTFRANDDLSRAIDDRCLAENINKSELIIRAIEQYLVSVIQPVIQPVIQTDIDDRFQALESKIEGIEQQLKAIVASGNSPPKTEPKAPPKTKTIAPGEGTIADQILQLMADGREWSNKELGTHFPGKRITSALSRLKRKGAIEQVKSESGKEIPGVHRIVKA